MMNKHDKKIEGKVRRAGCLMLALLMLMTALLVTGCKKEEAATPEQTLPEEPVTDAVPTEPAEPTDPVLEVTDTQEQGEDILVSTSYCTLRYPFAFSDLITVTAAPEEESLLFTAVLEDAQVPVFALRFGVQAGIEAGTLQLPVTGETVSVGIDLMELPEDLDQAHHASFYAAQEVINDVIASLEENEAFTPVE